jgi:hypothetical protein
MLNIVEEFVKFDVDFAHVWPLIQNTDNSLNRGFSYDEPNAPGEFFSIMREILPGKKLLDFAPDDNFKTEADFDSFNVHGFADQDEVSLFLTTSHTEGVVQTDLDITELVEGYGNVALSILGVEDGSAPGDNDSHAHVEQLDPQLAIQDGIIDVPLDPGEILIVRLYDYDPTPALTNALGALLDQDDTFDDIDEHGEDDWDFPVVDVDDDAPVDVGEEDLLDADDGSDGMVWLLALLPILALLGLG